ncbi:MAG: hypothetical protein K2X28_06520 [Alphaproteobacteria bacterium]|nr:hypothetical protein [Alphaproteobacteria bacterium]
MMSISRKIKLALFSSGFILASYNASAMTEEEKEVLPKGLRPLRRVCNEPASSSSSLLPQHVVDELSMHLAILKDSEGESAMPSSSVPNTNTLNDSAEEMTMSSSSSPTLKASSVPKEILDDIAGRLAPIGSALKTFLESSPTSPQTKRESVGSSTSPREKRKSTKGRGRKNTLEISSPSPNNMTSTSIENYLEELPNYLHKFSERFQTVDYENLLKDRQIEFYQLLASFKDVENLYHDHINPDYYSPLEGLRDATHIFEQGKIRRFYHRRITSAGPIKEKAAEAAARKAAAEAAHQVGRETNSVTNGTEEGRLSKESSLSSSPPLSPRGYGSLPPGLFKQDPMLPTTPTSPPLSPRGNRSFPSSPPPIPPELSKSESSSFTPSLLAPQKEGSSSPRPLPVPPSGNPPSSSISVSPPLSSSLPAPARPSRSRSISTPVEKPRLPTSLSPASPPPNRRWAQYSDAPVDLSGQCDESEQSD